MRKPDTVKDLAKAHPDGFRAEVLDVRDTAALRDVVDRTVADFGRIDVAISNAGYGVFGAAEELSDEQIEAILATNLTASIQFIRAVLPPCDPLAAAGSFRCQPTVARSRSQETRCITPASGASKASANPWRRKSPRSASASPSSSQAARAPNSVTAAHKSLTRLPAYRGNPARSFERMLDPANGLAPGDPARMATTIIDSVDQTAAPLRMVLGSQALTATLKALDERIADFKTQKDLAASTDFPPGE